MKNKIKYLPIGILTLTTAVTGVALSGASAIAASTASKSAAVTVQSACTFSTSETTSVGLGGYAGNTVNTESNSSRGMMQVTCNNPDGFKVQAVGFSPNASSDGAGVEGNTDLYSATAGTIPTGTSGTNSYWSFRVSTAFSTTSYSILGNYGTYSAIPSTATDIVSFGGTTSNTIMALFRTDYQLHAASTQASGAYEGAVKYTVAMN